MVFFRVDGNSTIGTGHMMRCLTLAAAFKKQGENSIFVTADDAMSDMIASKGFEHIILKSDWQHLDIELPIFIPVIASRKPHRVIVDSYFVTSKYLSSLTDETYTIYIDDLDAFQYPVNAIINYNIYGDRYDYSYCKTKYLGTGYCPLREEFSNLSSIVRKSVENILISTGGADPINLGYSMLKQLVRCPLFQSIKLHIIVGVLNPHAEQILLLAQENTNIIVHRQVDNMSNLMQSCDIAISASGSTLYELCAVGLPTINYTFADNQLAGAKAFAEKGIMLYAGDARENIEGCLDSIVAKATQLLDYDLRLSYFKKMKMLSFADSTHRLAREIINVNTSVEV